MGLKGVCDTFLSPLRWSAERRTTTPVPSSKEGDYGGRNEIFSNLRLARCKAADPWLWLAGLSVCRKREGVPLPRSGGGREGADASAIPYKHRLAHDPGGRRPSGRAFRCVGVLGFTPSRFWALLAIQKCHLGDSRAIYAFAKGPAPPAGEMRICPGKRIEKSSCHSGTGALFAGVNGEHQTALSTLPERKQRVQA